MSDNPLDNIPSYNRVSIRAVLVQAGEDPTAALSAAGIFDPVAVPVLFDEQMSAPDSFLGNGLALNLTGVLEQDQTDDDPDGSSTNADGSGSDHDGQADPDPFAPPAEDGSGPVASNRQLDD